MFDGRTYKSYRGMGSIGAMQSGSKTGDIFKIIPLELKKLIPEGIEGRVPYKGTIKSISSINGWIEITWVILAVWFH